MGSDKHYPEEAQTHKMQAGPTWGEAHRRTGGATWRISIRRATFIRLLRSASRPHDALLAVVEGKDGEISAEEHGQALPGLMIYRFDGSVVFFNADYFKERVLGHLRGASPAARWLLLDAESIPFPDVTGADRLEALRAELSAARVVLVISRSKGLFRAMLDRCGLSKRIGELRFYPSVHGGVKAFLAEKETRS
jgi:MFS superfamily sulfate permease-like transporter